MKYLFSDYLFLRFAAAKDTHTVGDAYRGMVGYLGCALTGDTVACASSRLMAGGLITLPDGRDTLTPDTPVVVTEAGQKWVAVSPLQKLLRRTERMLAKSLTEFVVQEIPAETPTLTADSAAFRSLVHEQLPFILPSLSEDGEMVSLTVKGPDRSALLEDEDDDAISLTFKDCVSHSSDEDGEGEFNLSDPDAAERLGILSVREPLSSAIGMREWLIAVTALATELPRRTRKLALHGTDRSYVVTLAPQSGQVRVTVAPIRFNRQRFRGKRDGDLDYAQCGENVMDFTIPLRTLAWGTTCGAICQPSLLDNEGSASVAKLYNIC